MKHYRAPNGSIHALDDERFAYLLPAGVVQITENEAKAEARAAVVEPAEADPFDELRKMLTPEAIAKLKTLLK